MSLSTLAGKTATARDAQTADLPDAIEGPYVPREIEGGVVIEAQAFVRTDDAQALRFDGSTPVFVVGLCSEIKVREALSEYSRAEIDRAIENGTRFERENPANANEAIAAAESPEVATDGGVALYAHSEHDDASRTTDDYLDLGELHERESERPDNCRCDEQLGAEIVCSPCLQREFATPNPERGDGR